MFVTSKGRILREIFEHPGESYRQLAIRVNLTERTVLEAVAFLQAAGWVKAEKVGRRNVYTFGKGSSIAVDSIIALEGLTTQ